MYQRVAARRSSAHTLMVLSLRSRDVPFVEVLLVEPYATVGGAYAGVF
jgi:hypothetical protein